MSKKKKHKKKFKAQLHQALQEMQRQQPTVVTPVEEHSSLRGGTEELKNEETYKPKEENKAEKPIEKMSAQESESVTPKVDKEENREKTLNEYAYVRKDVTKIVMIMSICIVLLVAIWILSLRTSYVSNFANQLANFSHLSQGK